jgi:two-component system, chemotaxis family, response regulator Rcp1
LSFSTRRESSLLTRARVLRILLVEDSPADIELTRQALAEAKFANEVIVVSDGETAGEFLRRDGVYADSERPDLILLDLNLPRKDGRELLVEIKSDPELRVIPVVVLTTSASDEDVDHAYRAHVNAYIRKPVRLVDFINVVQAIDEYWFGIVTLPTADGRG